ncbi:CTP synthase [Gallicola sp. Sow4_E12]|uniref:CTP synthase n=1 Tax=Gallicola sp. Sow4_E12 TaxID=3438785 RepID=UPI003F90B927
MSTKYIFITGGVVSSLGKGLTAASLGRLLKDRGLKVVLQKFDPYLNVDPGMMSPLQHGEVFVTDDGAETDLDVGHYERFTDINLDKSADITTGIIYKTILENQDKGVYGGSTVQVIPHVTNEIKDRVKKIGTQRDVDVIITEIGGTVGDIEGLPFIEAIRQFKYDVGRDNVLYIHVTLVPYLTTSGELKTKPTQHSVKDLRSFGIQPDIIILRTEHSIDEETIDKIALFCDMEPKDVIENSDVEHLYELPKVLEKQGLSELVMEKLKLEKRPLNSKEWDSLLEKVKKVDKKVKLAVIAKYVDLKDSYLSLFEALTHSGIEYGTDFDINIVDAEKLDSKNYKSMLKDSDGIIIPAGFGDRGLVGMVLASKFARENKIPFLGISMGMHAAVVDVARDAGLKVLPDDSIENSIDDIIYAPKESSVKDERRLGLYPSRIKSGSLLSDIYGEELVYERHRNRYEVNRMFEEKMENADLIISAMTPDEKYIQAVEIKDHPFYLGIQFQPEFRSRPTKPHPIFNNFVKAMLKKKKDS